MLTTDIHKKNKQLINKFRTALYDCDVTKLQGQLREIFASDCNVNLAFPFETLDVLIPSLSKPTSPLSVLSLI